MALVSRVVPRLPEPAPVHGAVRRPVVAAPRPVPAPAVPTDESLLHRALAATTSGVTVASLTGHDQPLVYVNAGFERLSGFPAEELLGRNCRFLQGPDTDTAVLARLRAAVDARQEFRGTLLNHRGAERTPWWNEVFLAPVRDPDGRVLQYIGVQNDVTERVEAQRAAVLERDRAQGYLERIERLASTDPLTGLANRRRLEERIEVALWDARADGERGRAAVPRPGRLQGGQRPARARRRRPAPRPYRGAAAVPAAPPGPGGPARRRRVPGRAARAGPATTPAEEAGRVAGQLAELVAQPVQLGREQVSVSVSVGVSLFPHDGDTFGGLLHEADLRMYAGKGRRRLAVPPA